MKEEYYKDLYAFQEAVKKYSEWMEIGKSVGTMTWIDGAQNAYKKMEKAKEELDLWHMNFPKVF
jgi:hypothetical protein